MLPLLILGAGILALSLGGRKRREPAEVLPPWEIAPGETKPGCALPPLSDVEAAAGGNPNALVSMPDPTSPGATVELPAWGVFQAYNAIANSVAMGPGVIEGVAITLESGPEGGDDTAAWLRAYAANCLA